MSTEAKTEQQSNQSLNEDETTETVETNEVVETPKVKKTTKAAVKDESDDDRSRLSETRRANDAERKAKELEDRMEEMTKTTNQKLVKAELRAAAIKQGIIDEDVVSLIDASKIKFTKEGAIVGIDDALALFKEAKPHFFGGDRKVETKPSTSSSATAPVSSGNDGKTAQEMTRDEWQRSKMRIVK